MGPRHVLLLLVVAACGVGEVDGGGGTPLPGIENTSINPAVIHTGFATGTTFQVPVSTDLSNFLSGDVDWSATDGSIVSIEPVEAPPDIPAARGVWAMITALEPGTTTIRAELGDHTVEAEVIVAEYTAADVDLGDTRYHDLAGVDDRIACASCHEAAGGADHSPSEMAFHDDAAILLVATEGHYPDLCTTDDGEPCTCDSSGCNREPGYVLSVEHTWNFTAEEMNAIVAYLRSLPPRGF